jgi:hypothetical protein
MAGISMLASIFDEYSLNARVRPSLLVLLPGVIAVYCSFPQLYQSVAGIIGLIVVSGFVTALAHFARYNGRKVENILFKEWGGKPTTKLLRHDDRHLDQVTKDRYHNFLQASIPNWTLPTSELELNDPKRADEYYDSAVKWLSENTRDTKEFNLLFKENIAYGFRRNSYGLKYYGVFISLLSIVLVLWSIFGNLEIIEPSNLAMSYAAITFSGVMFLWWLLIVNSSWVNDSAMSFAMRLLSCCDVLKST